MLSIWELLLGLLVVVVAAAAAVVAARIAAAGRRMERGAVAAAAIETFTPLLLRVREDPRLLPHLARVARASRALHPDVYAELDRAYGDTFPLSAADFRAGHERWTAEWLAWERTHDAEYKLRAEQLETALRQNGEVDSPTGRARLAAIEREKLERYQQRYEEYIRTANELEALARRPEA